MRLIPQLSQELQLRCGSCDRHAARLESSFTESVTSRPAVGRIAGIRTCLAACQPLVRVRGPKAAFRARYPSAGQDFSCCLPFLPTNAATPPTVRNSALHLGVVCYVTVHPNSCCRYPTILLAERPAELVEGFWASIHIVSLQFRDKEKLVLCCRHREMGTLQTPLPRLARAGSLLKMRLSELSAGEHQNLPGAQAVVRSCRARACRVAGAHSLQSEPTIKGRPRQCCPNN